jgi:hypothetical protein
MIREERRAEERRKWEGWNWQRREEGEQEKIQ